MALALGIGTVRALNIRLALIFDTDPKKRLQLDNSFSDAAHALWFPRRGQVTELRRPDYASSLLGYEEGRCGIAYAAEKVAAVPFSADRLQDPSLRHHYNLGTCPFFHTVLPLNAPSPKKTGDFDKRHLRRTHSSTRLLPASRPAIMPHGAHTPTRLHRVISGILYRSVSGVHDRPVPGVLDWNAMSS